MVPSVEILIIFIFLHRFYFVLPVYYAKALDSFKSSFFYQSHVSRDPVKIEDITSNSIPAMFKLANLINFYVPDKNDTVYVFNFLKNTAVMSPDIYLYSKRLPSSHILSDHLHYQYNLSERIKILKNDFINNPPELIVIPKESFVPDNQMPLLAPFLRWIEKLLINKYNYVQTIFLALPGENERAVDLFLRKK